MIERGRVLQLYKVCDNFIDTVYVEFDDIKEITNSFLDTKSYIRYYCRVSDFRHRTFQIECELFSPDDDESHFYCDDSTVYYADKNEAANFILDRINSKIKALENAKKSLRKFIYLN